MTEGLEAITSATLALALDAASLRQQAHALNIANATTEGYAPLRVSFEAQLEAARDDLRSEGFVGPAALEDAEPALESAPLASGLPAKVQLDYEVAAMTQNAGHFSALLKAVSRHYALLATAINEGKR